MGLRIARLANHLVRFADGVLNLSLAAAKPGGSFQEGDALTDSIAVAQRSARFEERPEVIWRRSNSRVEFLHGLVESAILPKSNGLRQSGRSGWVVALAARHPSSSFWGLMTWCFR
jgi:hypothetical protein